MVFLSSAALFAFIQMHPGAQSKLPCVAPTASGPAVSLSPGKRAFPRATVPLQGAPGPQESPLPQSPSLAGTRDPEVVVRSGAGQAVVGGPDQGWRGPSPPGSDVPPTSALLRPLGEVWFPSKRFHDPSGLETDAGSLRGPLIPA